MGQTDPPAVDFALKERAMDEAPIGITISDPDQPDNPLIYVNDAFERLTGYPAEAVLGRNCRFLQGRHSNPQAVAELRRAIDAAEPVTVELVNYRRDGEAFWNEVTVAPLRDGDGEVTNYVGFQVDVTRRKEAQLALADERERLDRLVDRINGLLADVTDLSMHGVDRRATERAIVDHIAETEAHEAAWIGEPDLAREELVTSAAAGFEESLDGLTLDLDGSSTPARAYREQTVTLGETDEQLAFGTSASTGPLAAAPLVYGEATYGVLVVRGASADVLDDRELVVLGSVGRTIATAINAAQSRRGLTADDLVELEFTVADPTFFPLALADAWDCRIEHRGSAASGDAGLRLFVDAVGVRASDVEPPPDVEGVESVAPIGTDDPTLVELGLPPGSIVDRLAERGAELRSLTAADGVAELEVSIPAEIGGRVVLELLEKRYEGVELVAYREREQRPTTRSAFVATLEDRLTERQAAALRSAYYSGYYRDPRTTTGDELADAMGVSRPTFHEHLRTAERKLLGAVFD